jgi:RNA polymerase sigma-70 factor (ECF subfamily)
VLSKDFDLKKEDQHSYEDHELLERFYNDGNNEWLGILLHRYTLLLFGVCMKYLKDEAEAKDAVQQIFLKVLHELPKYKVVYFKSWLYMIAKNHCLLWFRGQKTKLKHAAFISQPETSDDVENWEALMDREKSIELLHLALPELNEAQRICIIQFYLEKKSYLQITAATGFTMMQVKSHIQNGKRNLKLIMEKFRNNV